MIDKIAALRKIAYGGTPNYDSNPPPRGTFYINPADIHLSTNPLHSEVQSDSKKTYPPQITGGKMPPWMKRIGDRLSEGWNPFDRFGRTIPNKAPEWEGLVSPKRQPDKNPYNGTGRGFSDMLWRTPEAQGRYDRERDMWEEFQKRQYEKGYYGR